MLTVVATLGTATNYVYEHRVEAIVQLGGAMLNGLGVAIGGCIGSAIMLQFKSARMFLARVLHEIHHHQNNICQQNPQTQQIVKTAETIETEQIS